MVGSPHCCWCVRYFTGLHIPRQSSASHPLPLMVTLLCVIDQPSRSVAPSVSPPSPALCCNRRQSLLTARDGINLNLTQGSSWPFSARLQRSIFPVCPSAVASSARHQAVVQNYTKAFQVDLGSDGTLCQSNWHFLGVLGISRC